MRTTELESDPGTKQQQQLVVGSRVRGSACSIWQDFLISNATFHAGLLDQNVCSPNSQGINSEMSAPLQIPCGAASFTAADSAWFRLARLPAGDGDRGLGAGSYPQSGG
ncbi:hypothetical protein RRG08_037638 [Elysia crispata]|uniref:Uncharacterized protein n=1 Tax=Elysia crispata TaxID=231223 RepID=A0AAE1CZ12_9GAST|nr:hypothetical protein RRG08_037638 [Elysia crispata]